MDMTLINVNEQGLSLGTKEMRDHTAFENLEMSNLPYGIDNSFIVKNLYF